MPIFVREIVMEPADEQRLAVRAEHRDYIAELFARGAIVMSGPLADDTGAIMVYDAPDEESARGMIAEDPYTRAGVVRDVSLREWNVITGRS